LVHDTISLMGGSALGHDRDTGASDRVTAPDQGRLAAALQSALERLRLEGAVFLRAEYREPWAYESLTARETAKILRPDSDRVILFHVVASGACWVTVDGGDRHWARANVAYALEQTEVAPSNPGIVMSRLPELLLIEVLRLHLASAPAADRVGSLPSMTRCCGPPCPCSTAHPSAGGRCPHWRGKPPCHGPCSMRDSAKSSAGHRSGTSPSGGCTSQKICWRRPISASALSPAGLAMTMRKPSAAHSSVHMASRQAFGVPLICCAVGTTKLGSSVRHTGVLIMALTANAGDSGSGLRRHHSRALTIGSSWSIHRTLARHRERTRYASWTSSTRYLSPDSS